MPNGINTLSPDFRDWLLNKNLITDTIQNNGLAPLLQGIGIPAEVSSQPIAVQSSTDIQVDGVYYKDLNVVLNKYQGTDDDYETKSINFLPGNTNSTIAGNPWNNEPYSIEAAELLEANEENLKFGTTKNFYLDASQQTIIEIKYKKPSYQLGAYLDENNNVNVGGPSTQALDVIGSLATGSVGFNPNGGVATDFDVRSSLAGRVLTATGAINDTRLGRESVGYLATAIGNNIAFNLQEETIGRVNTNLRSLLTGGDLIVPNYKITIAKGTLGTAVDLLERMSGFQVPASLLEKSSSIFNIDLPVSNIERANEMIKNTGKGQILSLFANINENIMVNSAEPKNLRQGYAPGYNDSRISEGANTEDGINPNIYVYGTVDGNIVDLINGSESNPVSQSNYKKPTDEDDNEFNYDLVDWKPNGRNNFTWGDDYDNKESSKIFGDGYQDIIFGEDDNEYKKSILYKTKELFKSNNMRTLVSSHGGRANRSGIQRGIKRYGEPGAGLISKGSGVLSSKMFNLGPEDQAPTDPSEVFCRTWTTFDKYDEVGDLVRHSSLKEGDGYNRNPKTDIKSSVLEDTGFVRIAPYKDDKEGIKRFMFSIENLAWTDEITKLLPCEIGPGDPLSGHKGRIMWFPPYEISFNESVSVNWDKNNFIGRGEPIHTYNNTERTGTLSWKIIIDHPNYMNYFPSDWKQEEIASFFAGCLEDDGIRDAVMTQEEKNAQDVAQNTQVKESVDDQIPPTITFKVYFPNDVAVLNPSYENGLSGSTTAETINYTVNKTGEGFGIKTYKGGPSAGGTFTDRNYTDNTNFGLNSVNNPSPFSINGTNISGYLDSDFNDTLDEYLKNECKYCKIKIKGYASLQGSVGDVRKQNIKLSENRANAVKDYLKQNVLVGDSLGEKRFAKINGEGEVNNSCTNKISGDAKVCKEARYVEVVIEYDPKLKAEVEPDTRVQDPDDTIGVNNVTIPVNRFFSECNYFEKLTEDKTFVFNDISEKIKYFHPSFHSITPEGFNSRLNFLHQCTRQGPTYNNDGNPNNLAFGRPPICILRIGDFYHTKIVIDSLTIDYDPLVWDLNPEGVGVQPMIANVSINFSFIGGSSLNGPINKLQNALSYNFFANTEVYDSRADRIKITQEPNGKGSAELQPGEYPVTKNTQPDSSVKPGANDGNTNLTATYQLAQADDEANKDDNAQENPYDSDILKPITAKLSKSGVNGLIVGVSLTKDISQDYTVSKMNVDKLIFNDDGTISDKKYVELPVGVETITSGKDDFETLTSVRFLQTLLDYSEYETNVDYIVSFIATSSDGNNKISVTTKVGYSRQAINL